MGVIARRTMTWCPECGGTCRYAAWRDKPEPHRYEDIEVVTVPAASYQGAVEALREAHATLEDAHLPGRWARVLTARKGIEAALARLGGR